MRAAVAILALALALGGCGSGEAQRLIPPPAPGDCYRADRTVNLSPISGASAVLVGDLTTAGCIELLKAATEAKKAGVDVDHLLERR